MCVCVYMLLLLINGDDLKKDLPRKSQVKVIIFLKTNQCNINY